MSQLINWKWDHWTNCGRINATDMLLGPPTRRISNEILDNDDDEQVSTSFLFALRLLKCTRVRNKIHDNSQGEWHIWMKVCRFFSLSHSLPNARNERTWKLQEGAKIKSEKEILKPRNRMKKSFHWIWCGVAFSIFTVIHFIFAFSISRLVLQKARKEQTHTPEQTTNKKRNWNFLERKRKQIIILYFRLVVMCSQSQHFAWKIKTDESRAHTSDEYLSAPDGSDHTRTRFITFH